MKEKIRPIFTAGSIEAALYVYWYQRHAGANERLLLNFRKTVLAQHKERAIDVLSSIRKTQKRDAEALLKKFRTVKDVILGISSLQDEDIDVLEKQKKKSFIKKQLMNNTGYFNSREKVMSELFNITHLGKTKLDSMVKTFIWPFDHTKNNEINFF